jgi:hypothetical protein
MNCADVTFEMQDEHFEESAADANPGDLLWDFKGADGEQGHVLTDRESEPQQIGWEKPWTMRLCECGKVDLGDHHVVLLARAASLGVEEPE